MLSGTEMFSDLSFHIPMVDWARNQILTGHLPWDGWFPNLSLGASQFHRYESLPYIVTAFFAIPFGAKWPVLVSLYLLYALWPVCIYWTARLFDRGVGESLAAAIIAPLIAVSFNVPALSGFGFDAVSYFSTGLWPQLWAAWLLPIALGLVWRMMDGRTGVMWPALVIAATICSDTMFGYFVLILVIPVVLARPRLLLKKIPHVVLTLAGGLAIASWFLAPVISDTPFIPAYSGIAFDSFGFGKAMQLLFTGQLLDGQHLAEPVLQPLRANVPFPLQWDPGQLQVISALAALGIIITALRWRRETSGRALLLCMLVCFIGFVGPASIPVLHWLPFSRGVEFFRFGALIQLFGIYLAGVAAWWAAVKLYAWLGRMGSLPETVRVAVVGVVALGAAISPVAARSGYASAFANLIDIQIAADNSYQKQNLDSLVAFARDHGPGRIWGTPTSVGDVPVFTVLAYEEVDQVGYELTVQTLTGGTEVDFDRYTDTTKPGAFHAFFIRYLLLPDNLNIIAPAHLLKDAPPFALYEVEGSPTNYVTVVDTVGPPVTGVNNLNIGDKMIPILNGDDLQKDRYHTVEFNSIPAAGSSWTGSAPPTGAAGSVLNETNDLENGHVTATVNAARSAVALLSASWDNRWTATVDGVTVTPQFIAPSLVGVAVPSGTHQVEFRYAPYPYYWFWGLIGLLTVAGLFWVDRRFSQLVPGAGE